MTLTETLRTRYTTKAYDPEQRLPEEVVTQLLDALRFSPSSVNSQPWHFIVADDAAGKARIAKAAVGPCAYNAPKIENASLVIVLCAMTALTPEYLRAVLDQEAADGRFASEEARESQNRGRTGYVSLHEKMGDIDVWAKNQVYIAQGFLLLAAGLLKVDATPMEGFDAGILSEEFGLAAKNLRPAVIVALGHRSANDFNANLPKSRLPADQLFSRA
ncbi:oxygen-insensitive NAD(P)H nitroreductase [Acetobacter sp. AN02]|uniref:oxygen-insensitive NAD(P)H nitroreductase n=1 Tax=Acetobacter sp. AN02 TaxID=2894186 RepID=UPI0024346040|nr:oxygen-insensitive NAD(P)H nitroreductase [Acetobacter sp. AN02]MDG6095431.1 oxygen-insensitive NAD(P)H nitroreductase [Acetobacter sp. AN02]